MGRRRAVRRRRGALLVAAIVVFGAVVAISRIDFEDAIREVTLPLRHDDIIRQQAADKDLDPALIAAVIYAESKFDPVARSEADARGLMQITPATARDIERLSGGQTFRVADLADPDINIAYGSFYLRHLLERFGGNVVAALAAYNAGPANVEAWGGAELEVDDIGIGETRGYVATVLEKREQYREAYADDLGLG